MPRHISAFFVKTEGRCHIENGNYIFKMNPFDSELDHGTYGFGIAKLGVKDIKRAHQLRTDIYKLKFTFRSAKKAIGDHVKGYIGLTATKNWIE
jgi:hypothetical protein